MSDPYNKYDVGDSIRLKAYFKREDVLTDPTSVVLKVKDPTGATTIYDYGASEVTRETTGTYYKDIIVEDSGRWNYRFEGSGSVTATEEYYFVVERTWF